MKLINLTASTLLVSTLLFTACNNDSGAGKKTLKPTISEESLGLRKKSLYGEDDVTLKKVKYSDSYAGSGKTIKRAFQDAPPMIPHDVTGMIPIKINDNQCVGCHMPEIASSVKATPIPQSHFINFRPKHKFDGKIFKKSINNLKNETSIKKTNKLVNARFNCTQCHAPQTDGDAPKNTFKANFTSKDGDKRSSWSGSKLTDGLDTLMK